MPRDVVDNGTQELRSQLIELGAGNLAGTPFGEELDELPIQEQQMLDAFAIDDLELTTGESADRSLWAALGGAEQAEEDL